MCTRRSLSAPSAPGNEAILLPMTDECYLHGSYVWHDHVINELCLKSAPHLHNETIMNNFSQFMRSSIYHAITIYCTVFPACLQIYYSRYYCEEYFPLHFHETLTNQLYNYSTIPHLFNVNSLVITELAVNFAYVMQARAKILEGELYGLSDLYVCMH